MENTAPLVPLPSSAPLERALARTRLEDERARFLARSPSPTTARTYAADLRHFFRFAGVEHEDAVPSLEEVRALSWQDVARYRDHFYAPAPGTGRTRLAAATGARRLSVLSSFMTSLVRAGVIDRDPTDGVARPRAPQEGTTRGLSPDEVNRILARAPRGTLRADRDRLFLAVLFFEWLRISEAVRLRVEDLGEESGIPTLRIRQKGGRERTIALRREVATLARFTIARWELDGFLFPSLARGAFTVKPISADGARRLIWRPAVLRADLDPEAISPHSARVSGITAALLQDVPLEDVQDFAGHARPETTLRYHRGRRRLDRAPVARLPFAL